MSEYKLIILICFNKISLAVIVEIRQGSSYRDQRNIYELVIPNNNIIDIRSFLFFRSLRLY